MLLSDFCFTIFRFLLPPALICTTYIYFYAVLHDCTFPEARPAEAGCMIPGQERPSVAAEIAPFRLLVFADPQLEGDTSLPRPDYPWLPSLDAVSKSWEDAGVKGLPRGLQAAVRGFAGEDVPRMLYSVRKRIDLWGNDWYLAHIYRNVYWWSQPTHSVVLGDLLGSQWIKDAEFQKRSQRFWKRVFRRAERVPWDITDVSGRVEVLGEDKRWKRRLIAVPGNHDIGYAGDIDDHRIQRFEDTYGNVNWEIRFRLNDDNASSPPKSSPFGQSMFDITPPEVRLVILNSMNLDDPAKFGNLQQQSRDFITDQLHTPKADTTRNTGTVLLTHIPLFKEDGICADGPYFDYFNDAFYGNGIKEQNHLSEGASKYILDGLASEKKVGRAIVLNGHDHVGCDTYHYQPIKGDEQTYWSTNHTILSDSLRANDSLRGVREITVRSMMGSFGGNVGLLSGWFDKDEEQWRFEYKTCLFWTQHVWWFVHILDLVLLGLGVVGVIAFVRETLEEIRQDEARERAKLKQS